MKEHQRDVRLKQSVLSEHNIKTGHQILFVNTTTIATTSYFPRKYREAIEIQRYSDHLNKKVAATT